MLLQGSEGSSDEVPAEELSRTHDEDGPAEPLRSGCILLSRTWMWWFLLGPEVRSHEEAASVKLRDSVWFCFSEGRRGSVMLSRLTRCSDTYSLCIILIVYLRSDFGPAVWLVCASTAYRPVWMWLWSSDCSLSPSVVTRLSSNGEPSL